MLHVQHSSDLNQRLVAGNFTDADSSVIYKAFASRFSPSHECGLVCTCGVFVTYAHSYMRSLNNQQLATCSRANCKIMQFYANSAILRRAAESPAELKKSLLDSIELIWWLLPKFHGVDPYFTVLTSLANSDLPEYKHPAHVAITMLMTELGLDIATGGKLAALDDYRQYITDTGMLGTKSYKPTIHADILLDKYLIIFEAMMANQFVFSVYLAIIASFDLAGHLPYRLLQVEHRLLATNKGRRYVSVIMAQLAGIESRRRLFHDF